MEHNPCPNPYNVERDAKPPTSYDDASRLHDEAVRNVNRFASRDSEPWITSRVEPLIGGGYHVEADLSAQTARYGPGVYTLAIWANIGGESAQVAAYSIFLETNQ